MRSYYMKAPNATDYETVETQAQTYEAMAMLAQICNCKERGIRYSGRPSSLALTLALAKEEE